MKQLDEIKIYNGKYPQAIHDLTRHSNCVNIFHETDSFISKKGITGSVTDRD